MAPYDETWLAQRGYRLDGDTAVQSMPALPAETPEASLLARVRRLALDYGWMAYHTWRSDHSEAGFPDCVLVKPGRLLFAELKSRTGKLTAEQQTWLDMLRHSLPGIEVYEWRPADWAAIQDILTRSTP